MKVVSLDGGGVAFLFSHNEGDLALAMLGGINPLSEESREALEGAKQLVMMMGNDHPPKDQLN